MLLISLLYLVDFTKGHSWIECVDYNGPTDVYDASQCNALPRPLSDGRNVGATFGLDIGMDHRPGNSGNQCQGDISRGLDANYGGNMVSYNAGQTYTLAWPPKNHVAASCTNPYIPDTSLELFVEPYNGASDPTAFTQQVSASFTDNPHELNKIDFKGFQNCPKFCDNTDKALCTGTFVVPASLPSGLYTFQWKWAFNSEADIYSTCWEARVEGGSTPVTTSSTVSTSAAASSTSSTSLQTTDSTWNSGMKLTHFWDCNGMGCDATTLQPWDDSKYVASPGYAPQDPNDFGGSIYGEKLWVVGAASDGLASLFGADDGCCGKDNDSAGCGKCALIRVPSATNPDWTAVVMKKNRCPPWSNGCETGKVHFDVAAPGYDNLAYSTANVCGIKGKTGFATQSDSGILGDWYNSYSNTAQAISLCASLPAELQKGCQLFSEWGWTRGDPIAEYQIVQCPSAFKDYISDQFDANGVVDSDTTTSTSTSSTNTPSTSAPSSTTSIATTTTSSTSVPSTTTTVTTTGGACFIFNCGCPDAFKESWCDENSHRMQDSFCGKDQSNCETCYGSWCPYDGPGGSLTTTTTVATTSSTSTTSTTTSTASTTTSTTSTTSTTTTSPETTQRVTTSTATTSTTTTSGKTCALTQCGCGLDGQSWCSEDNSWMSGDWCHKSASNCATCSGTWCS